LEAVIDKEKYGFKDKDTGEIAILPKYDDVWSFRERLACIKLNSKRGLTY
jgi:hypothetical protein